MKELNQGSTKIFNKITEGMGFDVDCTYKKIENSKSFMPLVVELIGEIEFGLLFSFCHYFKQHGDLCQDPEMLFIKHEISGVVFPSMFQQAIPPIYQESIFKDDCGEWKCRRKMQADHTRFANTWLKNIKQQQDL